MRLLQQRLKNGKFKPVEMRFRLRRQSWKRLILRQWPYLNLIDLEWVEHFHCNRVRTLIRKMAANPGPQSLVCLPNIDGFPVVVEEGVHAELVVSKRDLLFTLRIKNSLVQKRGQLFTQLHRLEWGSI